MAPEPGPRAGLSGPRTEVLRLAYGAQAAQVVYVCAKLGLADLLRQGARTADGLALASGVDVTMLRRILRALVSLGMLAEVAVEGFALTDMGQYLRTDRVDSVQPRVVYNTEVLQPLWSELLHTLRTGESGAQRVLGVSLYEYFARDAEVGALFDRTMASAAPNRLSPAVAAYNFGQFGTIVDVGGGNGALLIEILRTYNGPRGIVFDLPAVAERARQNIADAGLSDRCTAIGGSALETVPGGGDVCALANVLTDMDDERACRILRHCRAAMAPCGRVVLIERVMPTGGEPTDPEKFWDTTTIEVTMLSLGGADGGRVRTAARWTRERRCRNSTGRIGRTDHGMLEDAYGCLINPDERADIENASDAGDEIARTGTRSRRCLREGGELRLIRMGSGYVVRCE